MMSRSYYRAPAQPQQAGKSRMRRLKSSMTNLHAVSAISADEDAIRAVANGYCGAWNRHDMEALSELFSEDAQWINIVGMHWPGRTAVVAGHDAYHRTFFRATGIEIADAQVAEIAPGAATAVILLTVGPFTPPDGVPRPGSDNRLSLVLTKRSGRWRITHGHNTVVDKGAQCFDPGADRVARRGAEARVSRVVFRLPVRGVVDRVSDARIALGWVDGQRPAEVRT